MTNAYFLSVAKETTGIASINKTQLSTFPVLLPPLDHQARFDERARAVEAITRQQVDAQGKASAVFAALLACCFRDA